MSKQTPPQRQQSPPLITLYRNLLVSYSDTSNIESLEFPFHTLKGRGGGGTAERRTERRTHGGGGGEGKVKRTVGLGGNNTSGTLGGGHMSRDGGRERRTGREHPKVRQGESECLCLIRCSS